MPLFVPIDQSVVLSKGRYRPAGPHQSALPADEKSKGGKETKGNVQSHGACSLHASREPKPTGEGLPNQTKSSGRRFDGTIESYGREVTRADGGRSVGGQQGL